MRTTGPAKAFILAAGYGTRMRPLSRDLPKPLMPVWGRPALERILRMLKGWGVRDVVVNIHHEAGAILNFAARNPVPGIRVNLSHEPDILGTGGALRRAEWFLGGGPFWLINADIVARLNPDPLLRAFRARRCLAALWLHPTLGPRTVEMSNGWIGRFQSSHPGADGTYTFCGLHLVSPDVLDFLPESGFAGIIPAYERAMKRGRRIAGVCVPGSFWADIGTPEQYLEAHRRLAPSRGAFAAIGQGVVRERNIRIRDSVVWDGAILRAGAVVENAVVGRGAEVVGRVSHVVMRAARGLEACEAGALGKLGWCVEDSTLQLLGPRGSARSFARIRSGSRSVILMRYSPERLENLLYTGHARFLARLGLRVPAVLLDWPAERLALIEDLGDESLLERIRGASAGEIEALYRKVLDGVLVFHRDGLRAARRQRLALMKPQSAALYRWERDFFAQHYLQNHLRLAPQRVRAIRRELARVSRRLAGVPDVLIHRDLQSSNILWTKGGPAFIDFQGMRPAAAAYDLASLLCDPYAGLPAALQERLLDCYARRCPADWDVKEAFWFAAVQRLIQALGAYARLSALPGLKHFERNIPPALSMLRRAADKIGGLPELVRVVVRG